MKPEFKKAIRYTLLSTILLIILTIIVFIVKESVFLITYRKYNLPYASEWLKENPCDINANTLYRNYYEMLSIRYRHNPLMGNWALRKEIECCRRLLKVNPSDSVIEMHLMYALFNLGDYDAAYKIYEELGETDHSFLAIYYEKKKDYISAVKEYEILLSEAEKSLKERIKDISKADKGSKNYEIWDKMKTHQEMYIQQIKDRLKHLKKKVTKDKFTGDVN